MRNSKCRGVTLVEMLVVLAIVGVMLAIFCPAIHGVRKRAREVACKNNVRQISLAVTMYLDAAKKFPPPPKRGHVGGWTVEILGFLEQGNLERSVVPGALIIDADKVLLRQPSVLLCPVRSANETLVGGEMAYAHYVWSGGSICDAPTRLSEPWLSSPEVLGPSRFKGPHDGGYFCGNGSDGVRFISYSGG